MGGAALGPSASLKPRDFGTRVKAWIRCTQHSLPLTTEVSPGDNPTRHLETDRRDPQLTPHGMRNG
jgi:hypothetical protein